MSVEKTLVILTEEPSAQTFLQAIIAKHVPESDGRLLVLEFAGKRGLDDKGVARANL